MRLARAAVCVVLGAWVFACSGEGSKEEKGQISGIVSDPAGAPVASAEIETLPAAGAAVTSADGLFSLAVAPGTYTVRAARSGFVTGERTDVTVRAGGSVIVDFTLVREVTAGAIAGFVRRSADSEPIAGATVTTDPATSAATSGADGSFRLSHVPPGTYALLARADGYLEARLTGVVVAPGAAVERSFDLAAAVTYASTCEECHLQQSMLLADLEANPPPSPPGETGSEGEG